MRNRTRFALTMLLISLAMVSLAGTGGTGVEAVTPTVTALTGTAWVVRMPGGEWQPVQVGEALPNGATLRTEAGARLEIGLGPRGSILMGPGTTLLLSTAAKPGETQWVRLTLGRIWVNILRHFDPDARFQVITPAAVVSVRGTLFSVLTTEAGDSRVSVEAGLVALEGAQSEVPVPAGKQARVSLGKTPEAPVDLDTAETEAWAGVHDWAAERLKAERAARGKAWASPGKAKADQPPPSGQTKDDGSAKGPGKGEGSSGETSHL